MARPRITEKQCYFAAMFAVVLNKETVLDKPKRWFFYMPSKFSKEVEQYGEKVVDRVVDNHVDAVKNRAFSVQFTNWGGAHLIRYMKGGGEDIIATFDTPRAFYEGMIAIDRMRGET